MNALSSALVCIARHPDQWRVLRDNTALARSAFEESIRFESPVQTFFRTTSEETSAEGVRIGAGEKVLTFLGAANRDPRRWPDAIQFNIRRNAVGHVGFGAGIHACIGQMFARLEGEIVLAQLARKVESL